MIKYLFLLLPFFCSGQFYKYATVYGGGSLNATMTPIETFEYNGELINTTNNDGANYRFQIGIKKLSRYKFEKKPKFYYDGNEHNATVFRSSLNNFEYLLEYEKIKDRGLEFDNHKIWLRYLGENTSTKIESSSNGYIDLSYKSLDIRLKRDFKNWRASFGSVLRYHPIYGVNAFKIDFPNYNDFPLTIQQLGYYSEASFIDGNNNGFMDRWEQAQTLWLNAEGDTVASSTQQMQNIYGHLVTDYNRQWINEQGNQYTVSGVFGLSYYLHRDTFFVLAYGNYFFVNKKLTEYGSDTNDYDFGLIGNLKLTKALSLYSQLEYLNYFDRENYTINLGINILII